MITETTGVIAPIVENIPEQLTERPQWVCWRLEQRDGNLTKVPYTPGTDRMASTTELRGSGVLRTSPIADSPKFAKEFQK